MRLLATHNSARAATADDKSVWEELRAYVRQAENFYRGATVLPWNSSPLNYYYSFLNLAKAYCLLRGALPALPAVPASPAVLATAASPAITTSNPRRLKHGVSERIQTGCPDVWQLAVGGQDDVFPLVYRLFIGEEIKSGTTLDVHDLFGFVPAIGFQLKESGYASRVLAFPSKWAMCSTPTEVWDVLGVASGAPINLLGTQFSADYEEVDFASVKASARQWWKLPAFEAMQFQHFQRKKPFPIEDGKWSPSQLQGALEQTLPHSVFEYFSSNDFEFMLCFSCPILGSGCRIPMNQDVASYAIMFFLSSLVRYHPEYMDAIAQSSDAWLIESFVKTAPIDMLRAFTAKMLGYTLIMKRM
jgi:hypothetical protein